MEGNTENPCVGGHFLIVLFSFEKWARTSSLEENTLYGLPS